MRRNFAQVLREGKIDINNEYSKLYSMFYEKDRKDGKSIAEIVSYNFDEFYFRGTCLSLEEFDKTHDINFCKQPSDFDVDYLVNFCEYIFNFISRLDDRHFFVYFDRSAYINHILRVIEAIGYMQSQEDGVAIFVPKNSVAVEVSKSDQIPQNLSYKVISYNHHSIKGDLESKRQILLSFADLIEPNRKKLEKINSQLASHLFYAFNNCNIRHNNIAPEGTKYKKPVADLSGEQLEQIYDDVYQMCLIAFMSIDYEKNKTRLEQLKSKIECK